MKFLKADNESMKACKLNGIPHFFIPSEMTFCLLTFPFYLMSLK